MCLRGGGSRQDYGFQQVFLLYAMAKHTIVQYILLTLLISPYFVYCILSKNETEKEIQQNPFIFFLYGTGYSSDCDTGTTVLYMKHQLLYLT